MGLISRSCMLLTGWRSQLTLLFIYGPHHYTGADRQTRCDAEESDGMRSLSADKCISDKRAAERLVSLCILTE